MEELRQQSKAELRHELELAVRNTVAMGNGEPPQRITQNGERERRSKSLRRAVRPAETARRMDG